MQIIITIIIAVLYAIYGPSNSLDGNKFMLIKIFNSLAMLYVISLSFPNLLFLSEIISGDHEPIMNLNSKALYYLYLISYVIISGVMTVLAFFLFTRRIKARGLFLMIAPIMIVLSEIKNYFIGLGKETVADNEKYAIQLVVFSTFIWLIIYVFISLRKTRKYFEGSSTLSNMEI